MTNTDIRPRLNLQQPKRRQCGQSTVFDILGEGLVIHINGSHGNDLIGEIHRAVA